jgi:hypothetical protein
MINSDPSHPASNGASADPPESIAQASLMEVLGAITLVNPTWTIIRHPVRFARYAANPGAAVHYFYSALGLVLLVTKWTDLQTENDGGDARQVLQLINRTIRFIGPNARLDGDDAIPVMLLFGNIIGGLTAYAICRLLARWCRGKVPSGSPTTAASQTIAATAYLGGACCVIFGIGLLFASGDTSAPPAYAAGTMLLFLTYCWGIWLGKIHNLVFGWAARIFLPWFLAFGCLCAFAAVVAGLNVILSALGFA